MRNEQTVTELEASDEKIVSNNTSNESTNTSNVSESHKKTLKKKEKRRFGDRKDGRLLRTMNPMHKVMPFIMPMRCDATNTFADEVNITDAEKFVSEQIISGKDNFSMLHVILAAYIRTIAKYPYLNRFVSGQRIYARNDIEVVMSIKKRMTLDAPDTCIKVHFNPDDTIFDVYEKFNKVVLANNTQEDSESDFDSVMNTLASFPRFFFRFAIWFLNKLDYYGLLPKALLEISPFHGSMIITSMGSLGIKPIYHHIYNFGNLPIFVSYGAKRKVNELDKNGNVTTKKVIDLKVVTDERTCDGFEYAQGFKCWKRFIENPQLLVDKPNEVKSDID